MAEDSYRSDRIDPEWPARSEEDQPVAELTSSNQGASSPFGEIEFPLDIVPYIHPRTRRTH